MSSNDAPEEQDVGEETGEVRDRLERRADRAVESFDEGVVDLLSWVLDTETRARIYVFLRAHPRSTSDEVAEGTGLYPSTVREELAQLHEEGKVDREKRESGGAGNNPYEYSAMAPSDLVGQVVEDVQAELNTVFNLDALVGTDRPRGPREADEPVTITVEEVDPEASPSDDAEGPD
jgi:predicted transcriptional regulator